MEIINESKYPDWYFKCDIPFGTIELNHEDFCFFWNCCHHKVIFHKIRNKNGKYTGRVEFTDPYIEGNFKNLKFTHTGFVFENPPPLLGISRSMVGSTVQKHCFSWN